MRAGWTYKKLGEICIIERGGSPRPIEQYITTDKNGFNWIKIGDAVEGSKYIHSTKEKIKPEGLKKTRFVNRGDFILSNSMSFGKPYILGIDGCIHDGWLVIRDKDELFNKSFLYYVLGSPNMYQEFKRLAVGGVVNNLNSQLVRNVVVPIPPLSEQERIVSELDLLSSIIEKKKEQLKAYDQLAQSIFYEMFGDPIENLKGWEMKKLEECVSSDCSISYGIVQPGDDVQDGVPVVRPIDLTNTFVYRKGLKVIDKTISDAYKRTILKGNEILFCVRGTTGVVSFASEELCGCNVTRGITPLSFDNHTNKYYIFYLIKSDSLQSLISEQTRGIALKQINMKDVRLLPVPLPPLSLQQSFASKIESIEHQKSLIQQSIKEVQTLFDSRMDYYFN